jgi:D-aminoacyl-tRNA deacylase
MSLKNLIVVSLEDTASCNIKKYLLQFGSWEEYRDYDGSPSYTMGNTLMVTIESIHLFYDDIDKKVETDLGVDPSLVIFASRHRSESKLKTLTMHPLGNYTEAKFGGKPGRLVPASPLKMTQALRILTFEARELSHKVSYEATHHGPYLNKPTFFIEIGSDEEAWTEDPPAKAIARTILRVLEEPSESDDRVAIGIGGGHYAPRFSEVALSHKIVFGHMIPNYAVEISEDRFQQAISATSGIDCVYIHKKSMKKALYRNIKEWFESNTDLEVVDSKKLELRKE